MKSLLILITLLIFTVNANANKSDTISKEIKAEAHLYAGTVADVASYVDIELRKNAIAACGGAPENIVGLKNYTINVNLNGFNSKGPSTITLDLKNHDYSGPLVYSQYYPKGFATTTVECLK